MKGTLQKSLAQDCAALFKKEIPIAGKNSTLGKGSEHQARLSFDLIKDEESLKILKNALLNERIEVVGISDSLTLRVFQGHVWKDLILIKQKQKKPTRDPSVETAKPKKTTTSHPYFSHTNSQFNTLSAAVNSEQQHFSNGVLSGQGGVSGVGEKSERNHFVGSHNKDLSVLCTNRTGPGTNLSEYFWKGSKLSQ